MRFLLFETFKFPNATVTAQLDKARLQALSDNKPVNYPLNVTLNLHGLTKQIAVPVTITRTTTNSVSVATTSPVVVQAEDFALTAGIARLASAAGGIQILPSAKVTFSLVFEGANHNPKLEAVITAAASRRKVQTTRALSTDECDNRMEVISKTRHIYFKSGSAEIDKKESEPVLNEISQFIKRCPSVAVEISGHTDSDGGKSYNLDLSERRAIAVSDVLKDMGVADERLTTIGYGYRRPVADNNTAEGKADNRRIEFHRKGAAAEKSD